MRANIRQQRSLIVFACAGCPAPILHDPKPYLSDRLRTGGPTACRDLNLLLRLLPSTRNACHCFPIASEGWNRRGILDTEMAASASSDNGLESASAIFTFLDHIALPISQHLLQDVAVAEADHGAVERAKCRLEEYIDGAGGGDQTVPPAENDFTTRALQKLKERCIHLACVLLHHITTSAASAAPATDSHPGKNAVQKPSFKEDTIRLADDCMSWVSGAWQ